THPHYTRFRGEDSVEDVMVRLAADEDERARIIEHLAEVGLVRDSGLSGECTTLTYGQTPSTFEA
ncbi:MAG: hypothetical protein Q4G43_11345, partial [Mobilicoccus sp.]|nr:hypothetical protein [Mobilicoccus sp.]